MIDLMRGDKKAALGRIRLILLRGVGEAVLSADYPEGLLRDVVDLACTSGRGAS
jgi:3-dehydroquinate synthase